MEDRPTELAALPAIFDRRRHRHRWLGAFQALERSGNTWRFVGRNWAMDHRVSEDREAEILGAREFAEESTGRSWPGQVRNYFQEYLCRPAWPDPPERRSAYLEPSNAGNAIARGKLPPHEQLVHVASLNGTLRRLTSAELVGAVDLKLRFNDLTGLDFPERRPIDEGRTRDAFSTRVDEIARAVNDRGLEAVGEFSGALVDALGDTQPPWWACFAQEVAELLEERDWVALCQALGLGHLEEGEWLITWRYEVGDLYELAPDLQLYRPTAVAANDNPCHFPSPPGFGYGIAMPLTLDRAGACREVLHPPLSGDLARRACTYELGRVAAEPLVDHNELSRLRARHRSQLLRDFSGPETKAWLERHLGES